jgi:hypothetical protein
MKESEHTRSTTPSKKEMETGCEGRKEIEEMRARRNLSVDRG